MTDKKYMEQQVRRFLEGRTTCREEQELYARFAAGDVPRSLRRHTEMFAWYAGGMKEDELPAPHAPKPTLRLRLRIVAAASLGAIVLGLGAYGMARYHERQELYARYEGSFIIRNGKKITDLEKILPELQRAEREALREEDKLQDFIQQETNPATASDTGNEPPMATTI